MAHLQDNLSELTSENCQTLTQSTIIFDLTFNISTHDYSADSSMLQVYLWSLEEPWYIQSTVK